MKSFDFFDTLFTRLVIKPEDVFKFVELETGLSGYTIARIQAESSARRLHGAEVTWDEIQQELIRNAPQLAPGLNRELEFEKEYIVPIAENLSNLISGDLVVSDMYLPREFFIEVLRRHGIDIDPRNVIVSCESKRNKSDGGLWNMIIPDQGRPDLHIGDDLIADVKQPRRFGIKADQYKGARINRYEKRLAESGLFGSLLAGCSRAVRLSQSEYSAVREVFASVFAPLIFLFCDWVIAHSLERGIRKIFFMARDGQLFYKVCQCITGARNLDVECIYINGSRQALHLPGYQNIDEAESWILENTPILTLGDISRRTCIDVQIIISLAHEIGLQLDAEENIPLADRSKLKTLIRTPSFLEGLLISSETSFGPAATYYKQKGLNGIDKMALVDIGWNGRMQRSLRNIINKAQFEVGSIAGFYLCLSQNHVSWSNDSAQGFLYSAQDSIGYSFFDSYRAIFESALSADHGATIGFIRIGDVVEPKLGRQPSTKNLMRVYEQQKNVLDFSKCAVRAPVRLPDDVCKASNAILENLHLFMTMPTYTDAHAFLNFEFFEGQTEDRVKPICRKISFLDLITDRSKLGFWSEGSIALSRLTIIYRFLNAWQKAKRTLYNLAKNIPFLFSPFIDAIRLF